MDFLDASYMWISVGHVGCTNSNVDQRFVDVTRVGDADKFDTLVDNLTEVKNPEGGPAKTIVFANQKATVDDIAWRLSDARIRASPIHGGLSQSQRDRALADLKVGRVNVLVASDVAARGLDLPGIDHVVNYELPQNADDYVHRIGRTGRIGNTGIATSLVGGDEPALKGIVKSMQEAAEEDERASKVPQWLSDRMLSGGSRFGGNSRNRSRSAPGGRSYGDRSYGNRSYGDRSYGNRGRSSSGGRRNSWDDDLDYGSPSRSRSNSYQTRY